MGVVTLQKPALYGKFPIRMIPQGRMISRDVKFDLNALVGASNAIPNFILTAEEIADPSAATAIINATKINELIAELQTVVGELNDMTLDMKVSGLLPAVGNVLHGSVEDELGVAVAGARVSIQEWKPSTEHQNLHFTEVAKTTTDGSGGFTAVGLSPLYPYNIVITKAGYLHYDYYKDTDQEYAISGDQVDEFEKFVLIEE